MTARAEAASDDGRASSTTVGREAFEAFVVARSPRLLRTAFLLRVGTPVTVTLKLRGAVPEGHEPQLAVGIWERGPMIQAGPSRNSATVGSAR